ncbi:phosphopantothenoylcysteine decarboxylase subunit SIS2-like isoform X1 [Phragmites australis]|uniref:phosphopantothenoylcysteine decarboxylase subunit SIS2-like isoform X1 n=1 Tax=Phragmites australis TaxID=29695 RepID=UPI002D7924D5|nr:phosphopantothenoylcysteine decarboxylase subunit SIS2-like isoform X1 [Phragmites australis]
MMMRSRSAPASPPPRYVFRILPRGPHPREHKNPSAPHAEPKTLTSSPPLLKSASKKPAATRRIRISTLSSSAAQAKIEAVNIGVDIFNEDERAIYKQLGRIKSETFPETKDAGGSDDDDDDDEDEDDEGGDDDDDAEEELSGDEEGGEDDDDDADPEANGEGGSDDEDDDEDSGDEDDDDDDDDDDDEDEEDDDDEDQPPSKKKK